MRFNWYEWGIQRGSDLKVESGNIIMLPVRAVRCPHKPHSVSDFSDSSETARYYKTRSRCSVSPLHLSCYRRRSGKRIHISVAGAENPDAAWYYANPKDAAKEIAGRVAFGNGVQIVE